MSDSQILKYYSGEIWIIWSILRGETNAYYWVVDDASKWKPRNKEEEHVLKWALKEKKKCKQKFTVQEPNDFDTLAIAEERIHEVFKRWMMQLLDFQHMENMLYALLGMSYGLSRHLNISPIYIDKQCIDRYKENQKEYLITLCDYVYANYQYARHLAEFDEHDNEAEKTISGLIQKLLELVPEGDIVNSILAVDALEKLFKEPTEENINALYEIQRRKTNRDVVRSVLTLNHQGELKEGCLLDGWQYLPRVKICYDTDFDEIEYLRDKNYKSPDDCIREFKLLLRTPQLIGIKNSEGNTIYWLISLLGDSYKKKHELESINSVLNRHIKLNQELVRSLSHSAANYLNSDKLAKMGFDLQAANEIEPSLEQLHADGLSLVMQSEQEMYLSRQLNSLIWRCSADNQSLIEQIRNSLSREKGESVLTALEFSLKVVAARILFRKGDFRSEFIRHKFLLSEERWIMIRSSFMLDVLAEKQFHEGIVINWWKKNITALDVSLSSLWSSIKIISDQSFYDLIVEIVSEQLLNAVSHGDVTKPILISLGQAEEFHGRPRWVFISCKNTKGTSYPGSKGVGISTLHETLMLMNSDKRGLDIIDDVTDKIFENRAWLLSSILRPL